MLEIARELARHPAACRFNPVQPHDGAVDVQKLVSI